MSEGKVRAYSDKENIAVALVHDVPAAHEIARWVNMEPRYRAVVKVDGIHWINMETEEIVHARFGDYVTLKPTGFDVVREEEDVD